MRSSDPVFEMLLKFCGQQETITVPRALITLTGDIKSAIFLSQVIWWSRTKPDDDGWFYKTTEEWETELALTRHEVDRAAAHLEGLHVLSTKIQQVKGIPKKHYRFSTSGFRECICRKAESAFAGKRKVLDLPETGKSYKEAEEYNRRIHTEEYNTSDSPVFNEKEIQNQDPATQDLTAQVEETTAPAPPEAPLESGAEEGLDLEDDLLVFVGNIYKRNRRKAPKLTSRSSAWLVERLRDAEASNGPSEFRMALTQYVCQDTTWLRENKWPLPAFLKGLDSPRRRAAASPVRFSRPDSIPTGLTVLPTPQIAVLPTFVQRWNAAVLPELQVSTWSQSSPIKDLATAEADPQFVDNFDLICQRCCLYSKAGQLSGTFDWLFESSKGKLNWYRTAKNLTPWAEKPKGEAFAPIKAKTPQERTAERLAEFQRNKKEKLENAATTTETEEPDLARRA